eukprot:357922-Chlamydomonas_euryale.AAC.6
MLVPRGIRAAFEVALPRMPPRPPPVGCPQALGAPRRLTRDPNSGKTALVARESLFEMCAQE